MMSNNRNSRATIGHTNKQFKVRRKLCQQQQQVSAQSISNKGENSSDNHLNTATAKSAAAAAATIAMSPKDTSGLEHSIKLNVVPLVATKVAQKAAIAAEKKAVQEAIVTTSPTLTSCTCASTPNTTTTATTINSAASGRLTMLKARNKTSNLIKQTRSNVSKTMINSNNRNTKVVVTAAAVKSSAVKTRTTTLPPITTMSTSNSSNNKSDVVGDLPTNKAYLNAVDTAMIAIDASKMTNTSTVRATMMTTAQTTKTRATKKIAATITAIPTAAAAVTYKSKSTTENKCTSKKLTKVSNQRELEATTTTTNTAACNRRKLCEQKNKTTKRQNQIPSSKWIKSNTTSGNEHIDGLSLEYAGISKGLQTSTTITAKPASIESVANKAELEFTENLSLAERKAKLKLKFFQVQQQQETSRNSSTAAARKPEKVQQRVRKCYPFGIPVFVDKKQHQNIAKKTAHATTESHHKPTVLRIQQIKPRIITSIADTTEQQQLEQQQDNLVAQRKLALERIFVKQTSIKTSNTKTVLDNLTQQHTFPCVDELVQKFDQPKTRAEKPAHKMIVNPNKATEANENMLTTLKPDALEQRNSPLSDEGCNLGQSPYSSDNDDNESIRTTYTMIERVKRKDKVARSASSDSALGLEVDEPMDSAAVPPPPEQQQKRRLTLTVTDLPLRPALLPLAEPTALLDSPTIDMQNILAQTAVPSKVLLEERVVEIPEDPRAQTCCSLSNSRRESEQSCGSDGIPSEYTGAVRYVRTPSVVVSDYSDEIMCGITLEEIEYFRAQRLRRRRSSLDAAAAEKENELSLSDVSAASSCSNLYYCGSTISALDGAECFVNGTRTQLERKTSDCSTCSVSGGEEDGFTIPEHPEEAEQMSKDLADLLAAQHLSAKKPSVKKVGLLPPLSNVQLSAKKTDL